MKIAAITKFKHGALFIALKKLAWSQSELARQLGVGASQVGMICNLRSRPTEQMAQKIEALFLQAGVDFDAHAEWPESFEGFPTLIAVEQIGEIDSRELEAAQQFHLLQEINNIPDDGRVGEFDPDKLPVVLASLTKNEQTVLKHRFGLNGSEEMTVKRLGKKLGLSRGRIHQIEKTALHKLRHPSRLDALKIEPALWVPNRQKNAAIACQEPPANRITAEITS